MLVGTIRPAISVGALYFLYPLILPGLLTGLLISPGPRNFYLYLLNKTEYSFMKNFNNPYHTKQQIIQELRKIPKKNKSKFFVDYLKLIQYAQQEDYDSFIL